MLVTPSLHEGMGYDYVSEIPLLHVETLSKTYVNPKKHSPDLMIRWPEPSKREILLNRLHFLPLLLILLLH